MEVRLRKNESIDHLIKRFNRKMKKEKIIEEYMERQHYKKPSVARREEQARRKKVLEKQKMKELAETKD